MSKLKKIHYAFIILLAISLIRGVAGPAINASSGLFLKPVSQDIGVGIGQLSLYLSIASVASLIWLPIAGNLLNKYHVKTIAILGVVLQTFAFIALGFMHSVWGWYLLAVPLAMGATILVNLLGPVLINRWFASRIGFVMGMMMTITSLSGAVFQPLLTNLIASRGWRFTYIAFGAAAFLFVFTIILLFLKNKPEDKHIEPYSSTSIKVSDSNVSKETPVKTGVSAKIAVKSSAFYLLLFFMIVLTGFATFSQHITTYGLTLGFSIKTLGTALSLSMIGFAIGSILIGMFSDKLGIIITSILVMAVGLMSVLLFLFGGSTFIIFAAATFLHGLATSSIGVVAPILTSTFFGFKDYEKLFSYIMMGSPLASIILIPAYGFIYDIFGNYQIVFVFLLIIIILGCLALFFGQKNSLKLKE